MAVLGGRLNHDRRWSARLICRSRVRSVGSESATTGCHLDRLPQGVTSRAGGDLKVRIDCISKARARLRKEDSCWMKLSIEPAT